MDSEKLDAFWNWFALNEVEIIDSIDNDLVNRQVYFKDQLDNFILDMGLFSWEIGQVRDNIWYLTISPNGDPDLLKVSKKIMSQSPDLDNWVFNYCKPVKDWDRKFSIYDEHMDLKEIDASDWKFNLKKNESGKVDIVFEMSQNLALDEHTVKKAAETLVINEIGEELRILNVGRIQIDESPLKKKNPIEELRSRLKT